MKTIRRSQIIYEMSKNCPPVCEAAPGERVRFLTEDAYSGTIKTTRDRYPESMAGRANPATGPLYVKGAQPGDTLAVKIVSIKPVGRATMFTGPRMGAMAGHLHDFQTVKPVVRDGLVHVDGRRIPTVPMIGVIGVAPRGKPVGNGWPGEHGGNMDCNVITAGSTVYLPVSVEGALLALGDVHAVQAAGEVAICAAETRAEVVVEARISRKPMITPAVERGRDISLVASAKTLDRAERLVLDKAFRFLTEIHEMGDHEAVRFLSLAGELEICQVVDPLKTMRVRILKKYL